MSRNAVCNLIGFVIMPGETHDAKAYDELMNLHDGGPRSLLADRGYDSNTFREDNRVRSTRALTPTKSNRKIQNLLDPLFHALRSVPERFFNKLKNA